MTSDLQIAPVYDVEFYSDEVLDDPYPHYQAMRDLAPVVRLPRHEAYAITRFADVRDALRNAAVFRSGHGVMMNQPVNAAAAGVSMLNMDDGAHVERRRVMAKPLMPATLQPVREEIRTIAEALIDDLVTRGSFDGVVDFAHTLPLKLVTRLVGLPEEGQARMLEWASGIFNVMGSINERFHRGLPARDHALQYLSSVDRASLVPGSWGERSLALAESGVMTEAEARGMIFDYVAPALDTTINGISSALWLLGRNPDQWTVVRENPALVPAAIEEALRLESPIRAFSRLTACDHAVDGVHLPAHSRVLLVYASANRDERRWEHADRFDVRRTAPHDQLAFGTGLHMCVGMHLARMEMRCLFEALAKRVVRFEVSDERRERHNVLRGLSSVRVTVTEAAETAEARGAISMGS